MMSLKQIFKEKGEDYFRDIENRILRDLMLNDYYQVISVGGGVTKLSENIKLLRKYSYPIWLFGPISTLLGRVTNIKKRPLFTGNKVHLQTLLDKRIESYLKTSSLFLNVEYLDKREVLQILLNELVAIKFCSKNT